MYPWNETASVKQAAGTSSISVGNPIAPPPQGRVSEAHDQTRKLIELLAQELNSLEGRLSPALRSPVPTGAQGADKARPEPSALAAGIETANGQLYALIGHVQALSARIDL